MQFPNIFSKIRNAFSTPTEKVETAFVAEALRGKLSDSVSSKNKTNGEPHLFDLNLMDDLYAEVGLVTAVVDKYTDFAVGPGHTLVVRGKNKYSKQALQILSDWERDINFQGVLIDWTKEGLLKGCGYIELGGKSLTEVKVLNAASIYKKVDDYGKVEKYIQVVGSNKIDFKTDEIATVTFNKKGDNPYGLGIIYPASKILNSYTGNILSRNTLLKRKANTPYHVKIGDKDKNIVPSQDKLEEISKKFETLHNKHEWVTGPYTEISGVDMGNPADHYTTAIAGDKEDYFNAVQIPTVLMGVANVPEGLAKVQLRAFLMRINAFQNELAQVIEQQIFKRILNANGLDVDVKIEWNMYDDSERNDRLEKLKELMSLNLASKTFISMLEHESVKMLELDETEYMKGVKDEAEKEAELMKKLEQQPKGKDEEFEEETLPRVPGQEKFQSQCCEAHTCDYGEAKTSEYDKDFTLKEWLGFNFLEHKEYIRKAIDETDFKFLKALSIRDKQLGKLSQAQLSRLRIVLRDAFDNGKSIKWIEREIRDKVKVKSLYKDTDAGVVKVVDAKIRNVLIARTETTRVANEGALQNYEANKIQYVKYLAMLDDRTSDICMDNDGKIFPVEESHGMIPAHVNCFIDHQIPIYTSKGWVSIGKLKKDDLVLSHKGKFRKVTEIIRTPKYKGKYVSLTVNGAKIKNGKRRHKITTTPDHPHLTTDGWKKAIDIKENDELVMLGNICKECGKPYPIFMKENTNFCSSKCMSVHSNRIMSADEDLRKRRSAMASEQMYREYANGARDKFEITKKANEKVREIGQPKLKGNPSWMKGKTKYNNETVRLKFSESRMGKNNPIHRMTKESKAKYKKYCIDKYLKHPELHPNIIMAQKGFISKPQKEMYATILQYCPSAILEHPVRTKSGIKFLDVAIPEEKIGFEFNGTYWHKGNEERDLIRQNAITDEGWIILNFNEDSLKDVGKELERVLKNHNDEYVFATSKVLKKEVKKLTKARTLYNFSVEKDESYIAKGFVTHNCRSTWVPVVEDIK